MSNLINLDAMQPSILNTYQQEGCGICEKPGGEIVWYSPYSVRAHTVCFNKIEECERNLLNTISVMFKDNVSRHKAHATVIEVIKIKLGDSPSILAYLDANGDEKLKRLFDSVGIAVVNDIKRGSSRKAILFTVNFYPNF